LDVSKGAVRGLFVALLVGQLVSGPDLLGLANPESVLVTLLYLLQRQTADLEVEEIDKDEAELSLKK
jgi:hypothetical protein